MKRLMFGLLDSRVMEEAGGTGGGGAGGGDNGGQGGAGTGGGDDKGGQGGGTGAGDGGQGGGSGEPKPFLGDDKGGQGGQGDDGKGGQGGESQPQPKTEEEYLKALVKDEKLLGGEKEVGLDGELFKAVVPALQQYNIAPEAANALANALAKAQVEQAKAAMQSRLDYFQRMKDEAMRKYQPRDFDRINAGIDKWFKPGGVMNNVIRNSELGADPEFLALMHELGGAALEDKGGGGAAGGGDVGDGNGIAGLSKMWK